MGLSVVGKNPQQKHTHEHRDMHCVAAWTAAQSADSLAYVSRWLCAVVWV